MFIKLNSETKYGDIGVAFDVSLLQVYSYQKVSDNDFEIKINLKGLALNVSGNVLYISSTTEEQMVLKIKFIDDWLAKIGKLSGLNPREESIKAYYNGY